MHVLMVTTAAHHDTGGARARDRPAGRVDGGVDDAVVGSDDPAAPGPADRTLVAAWRAAAPRCSVETVVVPPVAPTAPAPGTPRARPGVFVPTTALGLSHVAEPPPAAPVRRLHDLAPLVDLVVVHVDVLDTAALHDGPVADAARAAAPHAVPVVVLTGADRTTRRALAAAGVAGVHDVGDPVEAARVARVARTWCPAPRGGTSATV